MKSTAPESLKAALDQIFSAKSELASLNELVSVTSARRLSLECSCDLGDEKALAEITRLQVVEALLPRRIANREEAINYNEATLLKAGHDFISQHLGPRIRSMVERAKKSARARLETDFPDALALDLAVDGSALVRELDGFLRYATLSNYTGDDLTRYAERLLRTWSDCDAREAKLS